ncbi:carbon storage regulator [Gimesia algae]|uniref:carbon storage regulator n=1 Tax=Gimesia algae TaxID=2527971 RepID=UPI001E395C6C|nr:carbon storage regulator [Gimesia algae]
MLSRKTGESLLIDDFQVRVGWIRFNKVQLVVSGVGDMLPVEQILYMNETVKVTTEIEIVVIQIRDEKVRLGITAPPGTDFARL